MLQHNIGVLKGLLNRHDAVAALAHVVGGVQGVLNAQVGPVQAVRLVADVLKREHICLLVLSTDIEQMTILLILASLQKASLHSIGYL